LTVHIVAIIEHHLHKLGLEPATPRFQLSAVALTGNPISLHRHRYGERDQNKYCRRHQAHAGFVPAGELS
jgi:hypothetical protein